MTHPRLIEAMALRKEKRPATDPIELIFDRIIKRLKAVN